MLNDPSDNDEVMVQWVSKKDPADMRYFNASIQVSMDGIRNWFMFGRIPINQAIAEGNIEKWTAMINFQED